MARVSDNILPDGFSPALTLDRYQEIMRLPINAFNGLNLPTEVPQYQCSTIWNQSERDYIAIHLAQAEEMRIREVGYYLAPMYETADFEFGNPLIIDMKHLVEIGFRTVEDVSLGETITLSTGGTIHDPVEITVATTLTAASEIKVYYPGEDVEIHPSSVNISGGVLTIQIPRARLVDPDLNDNREDHLAYENDANFITSCDIKRVYYDNTQGLYYIWEGWQTSSSSLAEGSQLGWPNIRDARLSIIEHRPATYSAAWAQASWSYCVLPAWVRLYYVSGRRSSMITELETVRLSHTLMPNKPCSCPTVHQYWDEDIEEDERVWTPYGTRKGAVRAWMSDSRAKVGVGGKFPKPRRVLNRTFLCR
jgi:hypothetical protein